MLLAQPRVIPKTLNSKNKRSMGETKYHFNDAFGSAGVGDFVSRGDQEHLCRYGENKVFLRSLKDVMYI